ncbi:MAG: hypothetical protein UX08_C0003G0025 [Candidatus Collierbacteria bacterium GW2011_GWB1_45_35]|uniref:Uncharacterized protein n=1 Tax=Candidatus Collierbacteria bacterium GW2011_GWB2_45_17 TaxID=1618388 RepID=A0A837IJ15_9BACT|nr:MAG: hypothetical protein UW48_C0006G0094 [Microgenomates group bacterium GW2011_GWC1_44_23]KKT96067.1 MAG: hypothetical protein UW96_C0002G0094 [Candidatus Collierbacteria bacterium GW2011_GWA1_45_15]KKU01059.1 MAG: hypothetical protein UX01_C0002G0025 [Candidatus Collierbacteria bacterium GW2011_GWB2_45_17]KKU05669.1 MAG: hypothetical protein UX08_C0003G0025 [Candidatus Collierbacteria bacterium GW2011_GWB1_45_35]KKU07952.1 MAG: hypothetical protein UX11_C0008G0025 [Candidatus Collierbacte
MKKFVLIVLSLLILDLFLTKSSLAATPTPSPSVNPVILPGPNPAPPIGIPCGNTMCLEGEVCMQYPGDVDQHCVPEPLEENPTVPNECGNTGIFPPNSTCWNKFKNTQTDIKLYDKTCIYEPVVQYSSTRRLYGSDDEQPYAMCGIGECGLNCPVSPPGGGDSDCTVAMLAYTDVRDAELGSYGPSTDAEATYSADFIAQNYLYNSLFGRPMDLSDSYDPQNTAGNDGRPTREAYRTYWRLLPASHQANLRSFVLNMAHDDLILDIKFNFTDTNGLKKETTFKKLYDALRTQVILFWHFPFIRVGCLTSYPVCPEYAQATRELKPVFQDLLDTALKLNLPLANAVIQIYNIAIAAFGGDLDGPYAAFVPLDFSSTRGYIVKRKDQLEEELYAKYDRWLRDTFNQSRYGTDKPQLTNISRESLPYVGAIYQGLLSPKFGMFPALQPQWIIDKYATPSGISDYKLGNKPEDFPEVKIAKRNFLEALQEEVKALLSNPLGWLSSKIKSFFTDEDQLKGYTKTDVDNKNDVIRQAYVNMKGCPLPVSYHLLSPKTAAKSPDDHHQVISIPGNQLAWAYTPESRPLWKYECRTINNKQVCQDWYDPCPPGDEHYELGNLCYTRKWTVSGTKHGKALTVLNNPKQTDIKETVAGNDKFSFFKMILPDGASKITDASIDAPIAKNFVSDAGAATGPNGSSVMLNPAEPINRINNLAQDSMHLLQNCWVVPEGLQNSPRCDLSLSPEASTSACTGEAFEKLTGDKTPPSPAGENFFNSFINPKLTPEVISAYAEAEKSTGVPCEVLAGIHFKEGDNNPDQDLQSGAPLAGRSLTESAIAAAEELKAKAGGAITTINQLISALSAYNGGGNSNCQAGGSNSCAPTDRCGQTVACTVDASACKCVGTPEPGSCRANCPTGFPYPFSYPYCPPASTGYDDPYVTNFWISPVHDQMYILYMYDCTQTRPYLDARPGTLTVAISLFLQETK